MTEQPASEKAHHAVRLGFRLVHGLNEDELKKLVAARGNGFSSIERMAAVAGISRLTVERLAEADAFRSMGLDRRAALWAARRLDVIGAKPTPLSRHPEERPPTCSGVASKDAAQASEAIALRGSAFSNRASQGDGRKGALPLLTPHLSDELFPEQPVALPAMPLSEHVVDDYVATGLSLKEHPVRFFRDRLAALGVVPNAQLRSEHLRQNQRVTVAGLVLVRQRPGTAKGVIFMTLEDETDIANIIVWPKAFANNRRVVMTARFLAVRGRLQRAGLVIHVVAETFVDLSAELPWLREGGDLLSPKFSGGSLPHNSQQKTDDLFSNPLPVAHPLDTRLLKSRDFH